MAEGEPVERVSVTRRVPASAAAVFAVVSDPAGHVRIDGSGMLVAADGSNGASPGPAGHRSATCGVSSSSRWPTTLERLERVVTGG